MTLSGVALHRVHLAMQHAKFVLLLRDPVSRYRSELSMEACRIGNQQARKSPSKRGRPAHEECNLSPKLCSLKASNITRADIRRSSAVRDLVRKAAGAHRRRLLDLDTLKIREGRAYPGFHESGKIDTYLNETTLRLDEGPRNEILPLYRGLYMRQLDNWLRFFRKERFHFIQSERLFKEPQVSAGCATKKVMYTLRTRRVRSSVLTFARHRLQWMASPIGLDFHEERSSERSG